MYFYVCTHKHTYCVRYVLTSFDSYFLMMLWRCPPPKCSHFTDRETVVQRHVVDCLRSHGCEDKQKSKTNSCVLKSHGFSSRPRCLLALAMCVPKLGQRRKEQCVFGGLQTSGCRINPPIMPAVGLAFEIS